ncbi:MAG: flagellar hook-associated protein FlgL [Rhodospirillales bacterium]|nr:flagellar hook-associated protein FlgL [Rhodospirillales bacterium]
MTLNISDSAQQTYLRSILTQVRKDLLTTQAQISSAKRASLFNDLGGVDSLRSLSLRSDRSKIDAYKDNITSVQTRVTVMDSALVELSHSATDLASQMQLPVQNTNSAPAGLAGFNAVAQKQLETQFDRMNTRVDGRYVFSGGLTQTAPIDTTQMPTFLTSVQTAMTTYNASPQAAADLNTLETTVRGAIPWTTPPGFAGFNAATNKVQAQVDDQTSVDYTVKATDNGFADMVVGYAITAQLQYGQAGQTDQGFWNVYNRQMQLMRGTNKDAAGVPRSPSAPGGADQLTSLDAKLGVLQKSLDSTNTNHDKTAVTLETFIGQVEDTDVADALTRLDSLQAQLTASYKIIAQFKDLNLVNYL